jgi:hypothetical protein
VPEVHEIAEALLKARKAEPKEKRAATARSVCRGMLALLLAIGVALLPKLTCPACWPAYAGVLSALGLGFFNYTPFLLPLTLLFLLVSVGSLFLAARRHQRGRTAGPGNRQCSHRSYGQDWMRVRRRDVRGSGNPCGRIALEHLAGPENVLFRLRRWRRRKRLLTLHQGAGPRLRRKEVKP